MTIASHRKAPARLQRTPMNEKEPRPERSIKPEAPRGTRFAGESSSGNETGASSPGPSPDPDVTRIDPGTVAPDPGATMVDLDATLVPGMIPPSSPTTNSPTPVRRSVMSGHLGSAAVLNIGDVLGGRYEILQLLGEGGMGAVYKVSDRELGRPVALKVIRPELASNPAILARFKQELLLAHQVTHRNVVRVYDLGESGGVKFITMEFVEGTDLRSLLLRHGKYSPEEAVETIRQICLALQAAHSVGVIHRDLKPQNVMRDNAGRILVMDFGLARSLESDGMTQTGALVGTMEYMSPEQALGKELDQRSDIFALGLIFFELLTGNVPYKAETALASLLRRSQERAIPATEIDASVPRGLSDIVGKCLERDVTHRYVNVTEILADLDAWLGKGRSFKVSIVKEPWTDRWRKLPWPRIAGVAALMVATAAGVAWYARRTTRPASVVSHAPVSILVSDFQNNTSDSLFDDTLEPMVNVALEGASFINAFNRGNARKLAGKLPNPTQKLDEQTSRLVAVDSGVAAIVTGKLDTKGSGYNLALKAIDAVTGKTLATTDVDASNKDQLLLQVPKAVAPIRKALGDTTPESVQLAAAQGTFATSNVEAVHNYSVGMEQQFEGKMDDALKSFTKASELDPNFARAYAGMAAAAGNLGQSQAAETYAKKAIALVDRMTERERYRVRGLYYIRTGNWQKCVEEYTELMRQYPADNIGQNNLATCYGRLLNMSKAMEEAQGAVAIAPKDVMTRMNYSLYACYASEFESCERGTRESLQLNPEYEEAVFATGYAQLGQNQLAQAAESYQKLEKMSPWGRSLASAGLANLAMYEGRFRDAIQILDKGITADLAAKKPDAAADKLWMLAEANLLRGDKRAAVAAADRALANGQSTKMRFLAARIFVEAGEVANAKKMAETLGSELQAAPQAYGKLILGEIALNRRDPKQAIQLFNEAKDLLDSWIGRYDLGRAYLEAGAFAEADSEFDRCIKRRGEALELFMDDMPTYSLLPTVYYYQGLVREGLKSPGAADSYQMYLKLRGKNTEDPLLADIRRRIGK